MFSIKQPNQIVIGNGSAHNFQYPKNSLLITSEGAKSRGWIKYLELDENVTIYDQVENNPSMDTVKKILNEYNIKPILGVIPNNKDSDLLKFPLCEFDFFEEFLYSH